MPRLNVGDKMPDFEFATPYSPANRLSETVQKCPGKTALVFLRYYGCRMCQLDMIDYQERYGAIAAAGGQLLIALQSDPAAEAITGFSAAASFMNLDNCAERSDLSAT